MINKDTKVLKIAITGSHNIGKTFLCNLLINQDPNLEYSATIGVDYLVNFFENYNTKLCFWDFGGHERFEKITYPYIHKSDIIIFMYNIHDFESLYRVKNLFNKYSDLGWHSDAMLVGNFIIENSNKNKFIKEADRFAQDNNIPHIIINTKKNIGIKVVLNEIFKLKNIKINKQILKKKYRFSCFDIFNFCHLK